MERKYKHILETARALYVLSGIGIAYWSECVKTVVHLINRIPSKVLQNKSPFEALYHKPPNLQRLKAFGCFCYVSTSLQGREKFMPRSHPCIFLGYPYGQKAYKVMDLLTKHITISRNVKFFETTFSLHFSSISSPSSTPSYLPISSVEPTISEDSSSFVHTYFDHQPSPLLRRTQ